MKAGQIIISNDDGYYLLHTKKYISALIRENDVLVVLTTNLYQSKFEFNHTALLMRLKDCVMFEVSYEYFSSSCRIIC